MSFQATIKERWLSKDGALVLVFFFAEMGGLDELQRCL
jgi:hypothetical protein